LAASANEVSVLGLEISPWPGVSGSMALPFSIQTTTQKTASTLPSLMYSYALARPLL
jgi:hypothetical protein